jgi:hypothetical protein
MGPDGSRLGLTTLVENCHAVTLAVVVFHVLPAGHVVADLDRALPTGLETLEQLIGYIRVDLGACYGLPPGEGSAALAFVVGPEKTES